MLDRSLISILLKILSNSKFSPSDSEYIEEVEIEDNETTVSNLMQVIIKYVKYQGMTKRGAVEDKRGGTNRDNKRGGTNRDNKRDNSTDLSISINTLLSMLDSFLLSYLSHSSLPPSKLSSDISALSDRMHRITLTRRIKSFTLSPLVDWDSPHELRRIAEHFYERGIIERELLEREREVLERDRDTRDIKRDTRDIERDTSINRDTQCSFINISPSAPPQRKHITNKNNISPHNINPHNIFSSVDNSLFSLRHQPTMSLDQYVEYITTTNTETQKNNERTRRDRENREKYNREYIREETHGDTEDRERHHHGNTKHQG